MWNTVFYCKQQGNYKYIHCIQAETLDTIFTETNEVISTMAKLERQETVSVELQH